MKILVIGSRGFIGKNLKKFLAAQGHEVWGADVMVEYAHAEHYFLIDATNADYHDIFQEYVFDVCVNCSGAASVPDSLQHPLRDFNLNAANVFKILDAIRLFRPACRFINLSSAAVYGNPAELPVKELSPVSPVSPYGLHKQISEQICNEFYRFFGIQTCSVRIFSAYGEGLTKQLFWDLYQKVQKGGIVSLFGTGKESRDFIYIGDLVNAIYLVVQQSACKGEVINVANGKEILIEDCVKVFYAFFEKPVEYEFIGKGRAGDPNNWVADIAALQQLGYRQQYTLEQGLKKYYQWIKETGSELE